MSFILGTKIVEWFVGVHFGREATASAQLGWMNKLSENT